VVNASYPDVINPVLARLGKAPSVGIGNAGMIRARATAAALGGNPAGDAPRLIRVLGHHAHLDVVMHGSGEQPDDGPHVFLDEEGVRADHLAFASPPVPAGKVRNELVAATATPVIEALLPGGPRRRTTAPGPMGLPGGYPITLQNGWISLDLPARVSAAEAVALQQRWARRDGLDRIDPDGTVHLTEESQAVLRTLDPRLAEPLEMRHISQRVELLRALT
jgi:hypothetical protein